MCTYALGILEGEPPGNLIGLSQIPLGSVQHLGNLPNATLLERQDERL